MRAAADGGVAVLLISSELEEILDLSDRIAVMFEGRIMGVVAREVATREFIGLMMAGVDPESPEVDYCRPKNLPEDNATT